VIVCDCEGCRSEIGAGCRTVDGEVYGFCLMHYAVISMLDIMMQSALGVCLLNDVMILENQMMEVLNV
jgi:hypothetical protein